MSNKKKKEIKEEKENYLFKTTTTITEKEFSRFQHFYLNKFKSSLIPKLVIIFLTVLAAVLNALKGNWYVVVLLGVFAIVYPLALSLTINHQIKKMYHNSIKIQILEESLTFYKDYFTSKSKHTDLKVNYKDLYRICETKANVYLFISDNQAFIINKKNVKKLNDFLSFIKDKSEYKKYFR